MVVKEAQETAREAAADDEKFYRNFVYFFELQVPSSVSPAGTSFLFPLALAPQQLSMSEPFSIQDTPGADGGLVIEENGIIRRMLRIAGTTGWAPQTHKISTGLAGIKLDNQSWTSRGRLSTLALSGQRHFQFLQDKVFRTYGDLKRDPATADGVRLIFHNIKDDEHWLVAPVAFKLDRDARRPLSYQYAIDLLIVDIAEAPLKGLPSEDKSTLDQLKDGVRAVRSAVNLLSSAINDVNRYVSEVGQIVSSVVGIVRDAGKLLDSATQLVNGVANTITMPLKQVEAIVDDLDVALETLVNSTFDAKDTIIGSFRRMKDALNSFRVYPERFQEDVQEKLSRQRSQQSLSTSRSTATLRAAASNPPLNLRALSVAGTSSLPGDEDRARSESAARAEPSFQSLVEVRISAGDSLPTIAAQQLGDAKRWRQIAVINNLSAPYISTSGLPGTKKVGDSLLIPSDKVPQTVLPNSGIIGVGPTTSPVDRLLGRDLLLGPSARDPSRFDLVLDITKGGKDCKTVSGIANLSQALVTRTQTEQGTNPLYKTLGYKRILGTGLGEVDLQVLKFRMTEAVLADPRIANIVSSTISNMTSPDAIEIEIDAAVRGFDATVRVLASGPALT